MRSPELSIAVARFETTALVAGARIIEGRFEVRRRIGSGATGSVYEAFDRTLDRHVAIKVLEPSRARDADREAHILARIRHRNVVAIHDYGVAPGFRYLVLELLVGRDLRRWSSERPPVDEILARLLEAGRGLAAAHAAGLVHRDFKPSNLILTQSESTEAGHADRAVVIDFGLARNLESHDGLDPLESASSSGALAYLAPEYLVHGQGDARSDQFAWCVVLWEALTGTNPFTGDDPSSRHASILRGPAQFVADVPNHVARALRRGLSGSPDDRFASMTELLDHIEQAPSRLPHRRRRPLLSAVLVAATFALGWGLAPDPMIEHAVSDEPFNPKAAAAFILLDAARGEIEAGNTVAAKDGFDAATELIRELEEASVPYCQFAAEIEGFADALLAAGDLRRGRVLYTRALKFAKDCDRPREYIEQLESKKRSARETFLTNTPHEPAQSIESGESVPWTAPAP
jgi:hypothetical protein